VIQGIFYVLFFIFDGRIVGFFGARSC